MEAQCHGSPCFYETKHPGCLTRRDHNFPPSIFALAIFSDAFLWTELDQVHFHWPSSTAFQGDGIRDQCPKDALCCSVVESRLALPRPHGLHSASQAPLSSVKCSCAVTTTTRRSLSPAEIIILLDSPVLSQNIWWAVCKSVWAWGGNTFFKTGGYTWRIIEATLSSRTKIWCSCQELMIFWHIC